MGVKIERIKIRKRRRNFYFLSPCMNFNKISVTDLFIIVQLNWLHFPQKIKILLNKTWMKNLKEKQRKSSICYKIRRQNLIFEKSIDAYLWEKIRMRILINAKTFQFELFAKICQNWKCLGLDHKPNFVCKEN